MRLASTAGLRAPCVAIAVASILSACASGLRVNTAGAPGDGSAPVAQLITEQLIAAEQQQRAQRATQDIGHLVVPNPAPYTIGRGDILSIVVWDHPELSGAALAASGATNDVAPSGAQPAGFVVDYEGRIQFPFAGTLTLVDLTEEAARDLLAAKLARYIATPSVTLRVQAYRSKRIYIDGDVKLPGLQAINDIPMTLMEALNRAGGLLPSADQSRIVLDRGATRYQLDLRGLVQKGINPANVLLAHGDVVRVHTRDESKVFVSGEVTTPRALTMHDGRLSLNEALGESGGINPLSGDARQIFVVRKTEAGTRVYRLDASQASALALAEAFELNPKDVVYVAASPMANWNRGISLLFPGALTSVVGVTKP
jgi:polysaccharide export outer membrane protein